MKYALGELGEGMMALAAKDYFFDDSVRRIYFENFTNLVPMERKGSLRKSLAWAFHLLQQGYNVLVFPEGTRVAPGKRGHYRIGGAALAKGTGYAITPVAHNAGEYWPRRTFIKRPGVIQVRIGPAIETGDKTAQQILAEAEDWIETEMAKITTLKQHQHRRPERRG